MSIASTVFRNVASNWVGLLLNLVITFFLSPFVVNTLGSVYFGIWALTMQFTGYLFILDFGVRDSIVRYTARYRGLKQRHKLNRLLTTSLAIYAPIALTATAVTAIGVAGFPHWFNISEEHVTEVRISLGLVGLTLAQGFLFNGFAGVLQGLQRFDVTNVIGVAGSVLRAALVVAALKMGYGIVGLAAVQFALSVAGSLLTTHYALLFLRREGLDFRPVWTTGRRGRALVRRIVGYSAYVFINNIAGKVIFSTDAVVIGIFLPVSSVTYYAIAGNLVGLLRAMVTATVWVLMPLVSHYAALRQFDDVRVLLIRASKTALLVALPLCVGFIVLGRDFVALWMGEEFAPLAGEVLVILAVAEIFSSPQQAMSAVLMGLNRHRVMALLRVAEAAVNLGLSVWLVKRLGLAGVALGTAIPSIVAVTVVLPMMVCRVVGLPVRTYLLRAYAGPTLAILPFAAGSLCIAAWWPPTTLLVFFAQMGVLSLVYMAGVYAVALTKEERALADSQILRVLSLRVLDR